MLFKNNSIIESSFTGIDDAFLMIHAWQRICVERREARLRTPRNDLCTDSLRNRIAEMVVDVGPSIAITSATNVLAFVIGIYSPTPEIVLFCAGNAVAIFFDFVYQFVLFTPVMVIAAEFEMKSEAKRDAKSIQNVKATERRKEFTKHLLFVLDRYCKWCADGFTFVLTLLILIVYWIVSVRGALSINASITPGKLFLADSLVTQMNDLRNQYILPNYTAINVFVNNVGDLSNDTQQERIRSLIADFEKMPECLGPDYTHFWMRDFDKYLETTVEDESEFEEEEPTVNKKKFKFTKEEMKPFLNWPEYKHWNGFIRFSENGYVKVY